MLIPKNTLNALIPAVQIGNSVLGNNLILTQNRTIAMNEFSLYYREHEPCTLEDLPVCIPVKAIDKAVKNAKDSIAFKIEEDTVNLVTMDSTISNTVSVKIDNTSFVPDYLKVIQATKDCDVNFGIALSELERLVKVAKRTKNCVAVSFSVKDGESPIAVSLDDSKIQGIIMPYCMP